MEKIIFFLRSITSDRTLEEFKTLLQYSQHTQVCTLTTIFQSGFGILLNTPERIPKALTLLKILKPHRRVGHHMQIFTAAE